MAPRQLSPLYIKILIMLLQRSLITKFLLTLSFAILPSISAHAITEIGIDAKVYFVNGCTGKVEGPAAGRLFDVTDSKGRLVDDRTQTDAQGHFSAVYYIGSAAGKYRVRAHSQTGKRGCAWNGRTVNVVDGITTKIKINCRKPKSSHC